MRTLTNLLFVAVMAALCAGCMSYQQHIVLAPDGSGTAAVDFWMESFSDLLKTEEVEDAQGAPGAATAEGEAAAAPPTLEISEEMGPAFQDLKGVTIEENWIRLEPGEDGSDRQMEHTRLVLSFDKLERLNGVGVFKSQKMSFKAKGKKFEFKNTLTNEKKEPSEETTPEAEELTRQMFEGYTFTYSVEMPAPVKSSNGTVGDDGRTVTWRWPLYDFSQLEQVEMNVTAAQ